jgi:hypothetical protein
MYAAEVRSYFLGEDGPRLQDNWIKLIVEIPRPHVILRLSRCNNFLTASTSLSIQSRYAASVLPAELVFVKPGADSECEIKRAPRKSVPPYVDEISHFG